MTASNFQLNLARHRTREGEEIIILMTRKEKRMGEGGGKKLTSRRPHIAAVWFLLLPLKGPNGKVAEQSQSVRGSNFFLLFGGGGGEKLFSAVTQKTP